MKFFSHKLLHHKNHHDRLGGRTGDKADNKIPPTTKKFKNGVDFALLASILTSPTMQEYYRMRNNRSPFAPYFDNAADSFETYPTDHADDAYCIEADNIEDYEDYTSKREEYDVF